MSSLGQINQSTNNKNFSTSYKQNLGIEFVLQVGQIFDNLAPNFIRKSFSLTLSVRRSTDLPKTWKNWPKKIHFDFAKQRSEESSMFLLACHQCNQIGRFIKSSWLQFFLQKQLNDWWPLGATVKNGTFKVKLLIGQLFVRNWAIFYSVIGSHCFPRHLLLK